jgi:hypothetical protein
MATRKVGFAEKSQVRNLYMNPGAEGAVSFANNYAVPTKRNNGVSNISNSKAIANQMQHPRNYRWDRAYSYTDTFKTPRTNAGERELQNAKRRKKYGNKWANAVVIEESYADDLKERTHSYYAKITDLFNAIFTGKDPEILKEFIKYLDKMNNLHVAFESGKMKKAVYDAELYKIFNKCQEKTQIDKELLIMNYPKFKEIFVAKLALNTRALSQMVAELNVMAKSKKADNAARALRNKTQRNVNRRWSNAKGPLLALAATHSNKPENFRTVYNYKG